MSNSEPYCGCISRTGPIDRFAFRPRAAGRAVVTLLTVAALLLVAGGRAEAHQLNVFAYIDGDTVVVEARFSSGRMAQVGTARLYDGQDQLIDEAALARDGTARMPLRQHASGLRIEVTAADGHTNYWVLTAQDIAAQQRRAGQ